MDSQETNNQKYLDKLKDADILPEEIEQFKKLVKIHYGIELTDDQAIDQAERFITLITLSIPEFAKAGADGQ